MLESSTATANSSGLTPSHLSSPILYYVNDKDLIEQARQHLFNNYFFDLCTAEQQEQLMKSIKISRYHHGQTIFRQGIACNELTLILKGTIKMSWNIDNGKCITHRFLPTGFLINIVPLMSKRPLVHDHIAHDATIIATVSGEIFLSILQNNPKFSYNVFEMICKRNHILFEETYHRASQPLRIRLAREFMILVDFFSKQEAEGIKITIKLSQEHFAELLQTSRQSINKELLWLSQEGIAEAKYNQITILDLKKLKALLH
ncbi:MAG: Crp/Fnr family transcriptional regulator [Acinetobacter sp.]|uniref:Crp/Fnr family transcriptional regulator n=1 Tax=Acinetobacter sp. TaxID=472 RepID=UPI002590DBC0|nr:Crp/Fnr family transcriptional regulator [Acinetobacter sp.]MCE1270654.1 Crp/Fnr family transcriptional regulator [Acinetobacter sp.]